ncbi:MAG: AI-2E family transporter [Sandaracinaceae bacterium]|nr:AI-2E family transporter [Sandaracinaceae bacterium]
MARSNGGQAVYQLAALVIICAGLHWAAPVFVPFLLALFISMLSSPIVLFMTDRKVPRPIAVIGVLLMDIAAVTGVVFLFVRAATDFYSAWPRYAVLFQRVIDDFALWINERGGHVTADSFYSYADTNALVTLATETAAQAAHAFGNLVVVLLIVAFLLLESTVLRAKLSMILRDPDDDIERFTGIAQDVQKYLFVKTVTSFATAILVGLIVVIFDVDFPLLWALFAFFLNFLPSVGSIIAGIPPILLTLAQHGFGSALAMFTTYTVINFTIGNFIEPRVMGRALGLSVVVVFVSMLFWGWLWGPVGAFLAVPLTMTAKIILSYTDDLQWVAVLIGAPPEKQDVERALSMRPPKVPTIPPV